MASNENLSPNVIKQLARELKNLDESPPEGIKVVVNNDDFSTIYADIKGLAETPYKNGVFLLKLVLSHDFPHSPPKGYFLTKIFHPNIANNGEICVNTLKKYWNPHLGLCHVPSVVKCLVIEPFPESALNEQAGKMLLENYEQYARNARLYTGIQVKPTPKFKTGAISESTAALNVDQSNTTVHQKITAPSYALQLASHTTNGMNWQDQVLVRCFNHKFRACHISGLRSEFVEKGERLAKAQAEKKKIDARKKSLKRL